MKLLWVKAGKILPVDTGGRIRSYHILRSLAVREEVTFISYYGGKRDVEYEATLKDKIPGAVTIYTAAPDTTALERQVDYLRRLPQSAPYAVSKFTHPLAQKAVASWFSDQGGEVAVCDFLSASLNFPERLSKPTVLFQHNGELSLAAIGDNRGQSGQKDSVQDRGWENGEVRASCLEEISTRDSGFRGGSPTDVGHAFGVPDHGGTDWRGLCRVFCGAAVEYQTATDRVHRFDGLGTEH
jgi:hypothetical protein